MPTTQISTPCERVAWRRAAAVAVCLLFSLIAAVPASLTAQQLTARRDTALALSLASTLDAARASSPVLRAAREALTAARARERQARAFANPVLGYGREQTTGGGQKNSQDIAQLEQPVEFGGQRAARGAAAGARAEIAAARLKLAERDLVFETTRAYATLAAAQRRVALAQEASRAFIEAERITAERLRAGDVAGYDARRLQLEAARYAVQAASARLALHQARIALAMLVDLPPASVGASLGTQRGESLASTDALTAVALAARPDLLVLQRQIDVARADARLAMAERRPVLTLSAGYKRESSATPQIPSPASLHGFVAGFSLPLPVFDRRRGAIEAAVADTRVREAESDSLRRRIRAEVDEARAAVDVVESQLALLRPQLGENMHAALRAVQAAYVEGEIPLTTWLDAVRAYQDAEGTFASLEADAMIRRAALERAVGTTLCPSASR